MANVVGVALFVVAVAVAIGLHEYGHYFTARRFGMRAERFFFGFGPTVWSTRRGETEVGVKAFPLGGFVRIAGMSTLDKRQPPVADVVFANEAVAADRREGATELAIDVLEAPALPEATWRRLDDELERRGVPTARRRTIVERTMAESGADAAAPDAATAFLAVAADELSDTGRVGDLRHRVLRGDDGRFFHDRPPWQRAIVLSAGSAMHFLQAAVVLLLAFAIFGRPTEPEPTPVIDLVQEETPAAAAGLRPGDRIVEIEGAAVTDFAQVRNVIRERTGTETEIVIERDGARQTFAVTPEEMVDPETGERYGVIGFVPVHELRFARLSPLAAVRETFVGEFGVPAQMWGALRALGSVFGPEGIGSIFNQISGDEPRDPAGAASLVGAGRAAGQLTAQGGAFYLLLIVVGLNIFVGVFNMLPLPPLDGGHIAVLAVERVVNAVRRRRGEPTTFRVDPRTVTAIAVPVLVVLGTLTLMLVWLDIVNPIQL